MIPTAIIVKDDNPELDALYDQLKQKVRVYYRTSLQGEKLYGVREGILYFDDKGSRQLLIQDEYSDTIRLIENKLKLIGAKSRELLIKHLVRIQE